MLAFVGLYLTICINLLKIDDVSSLSSRPPNIVMMLADDMVCTLYYVIIEVKHL